MYRVSPFSYMVSGMLAVGVANTAVTCAPNEYLHFEPPSGQTCGEYMSTFQKTFGGYPLNAEATSDCSYCSVGDTNVFLAAVHAEYSNVWRNFGILWVYVIFNIVMALVFYWLVRVPKKPKAEKAEQAAAREEAQAEHDEAMDRELEAGSKEVPEKKSAVGESTAQPSSDRISERMVGEKV